jgi:hypothetical protein
MMRRLRWPWGRTSDEEYIAQLRRSFRWWDRWKFWIILLHAGLLVLGLWVFSRIIPLILNAPVVVLGFATGTIIGIVFSWTIYGIVNSLGGMIHGFRAERLLLALLDATDSETSERQNEYDPGTEGCERPEDSNRG